MPPKAAVSPSIDVHETHIGAVFLVGDRAYKLKKPVNFGFVDFTERRAREFVCHREVALNRRLAPDVYLGVADVTGPDHEVCDHLVVMRRMPEDRRLTNLVRDGEPLTETIRHLARMLAKFHANADRGPQIAEQGSRDAILTRWDDSFKQVRAFHGTVLDHEVAGEIERLTHEFLAGRKALFDRRQTTERIVDGHGDLLADDIFCLDDGPRVLDCLEFDDRLRWVDGLDDVAFLAMDLERLGAPGLGELLLGYYADFSGDPAPPALRHHYLAYRAFVRSKVACLRFAQTDDPDGRVADLARAYAGLTLRHLRQGRPRMILVGGLPGSGKSTLADALADRLGATVLCGDRIRKELAGIAPEDSAAADYRTGLYDPEHTHRTYAELRRRARELLGLGETVVLDASWIDAAQRRAAVEAAGLACAPAIPIRCWAPEAVTTKRLAARPGAISDATPEIARHMTADTHPWPEAHTILTAGEPGDSLTQALACLEQP